MQRYTSVKNCITIELRIENVYYKKADASISKKL